MYPIILLTQTEMKARWDKDLCYNCDEVYSFEHRCAKIQLYMLKDEEEGDEEEVENTEIVFDSGEELIEAPDPEPTPIKANSGSDLESHMLNLPELEGVRPEPETRTLGKEIKHPDSTIVTGLSQLQEAPIEASIDAKETKSWPKPNPKPNLNTPPNPSPNQNQSTKTINLNTDPTPNLPTLAYPNQRATIIPPNRNLPTLSYPNPNSPPIQTQSFQAIIQDTAAYLNANRPKPWPDNPHVYTFINTQTTEVMSRNLQQYKSRKSYHIQLLVNSKSDDQPWASPVADQARIPAQKVFDPGGNGSFEEGLARLRFGCSFGHFGRIVDEIRRWIKVSGHRFSERRRIGNEEESTRAIVEDPSDGRSPLILINRFRNYSNNYPRTSVVAAWICRRRRKSGSESRFRREKKGLGIRDLKIWGFYSMEFWLSKKKKVWRFSRDFGFGLSRKKKIWKFLSNDRFSFVMEEVLCVVLVEKVKDLGVVLMVVRREKEEDLCCVEGRRNEEDKLLGLRV